MTGEQIAQTQAVAENITDRLIHLSDDIKAETEKQAKEPTN